MFGQLRKKHRKLSGIDEYKKEICIKEDPYYLIDNMEVIKHVLNTTKVVKNIKDNHEDTWTPHTNNYYTFSSIGQSLLGDIDYNHNERTKNRLLRENIIQMIRNNDYENLFDYFFKFEYYIIRESDEDYENPYYNYDKSVLNFYEKIEFEYQTPHNFLKFIEDNWKEGWKPIFKVCLLSLLYVLTGEVDKSIIDKIFGGQFRVHVYYSTGDDKIYCIVGLDMFNEYFINTIKTFSLVQITKNTNEVDVMILGLDNLYTTKHPHELINQCFEYISSLGLGQSKMRVTLDPNIR